MEAVQPSAVVAVAHPAFRSSQPNKRHEIIILLPRNLEQPIRVKTT